MKVLVVDDAPANRLILSALLQRTGYSALTAGGVEEAERQFAAEHPEAVLTDLRMPHGEEGVELARHLRSTPEGKSLKIAVMTGDATSALADEGLFDAILEKPVKLENLLDFLKETKS